MKTTILNTIKFIFLIAVIYVLLSIYYSDFEVIYWSQKETKEAVLIFFAFISGWFSK